MFASPMTLKKNWLRTLDFFVQGRINFSTWADLPRSDTLEEIVELESDHENENRRQPTTSPKASSTKESAAATSLEQRLFDKVAFCQSGSICGQGCSYPSLDVGH
jgi:hypothetical protein